MQQEKLASQLLSDLKTSPKKAALLALLVGVAAYFWLPLAAGLLPSGDSEPETPALAPILADLAGEVATAEPVQVEPKHDWQTIIAAVQADPRTKPPQAVRWSRDPFAEEVEVAEAEPIAAAPETDPADALPSTAVHLLLTGTLIGNRHSTAMINGVTYREGDELEVIDGLALTVVAIRTRAVILRWQDVQVELPLNKEQILPPELFAGPAADSPVES